MCSRTLPWTASFELSLILLFAYASYSTAEASGGSGILALFTTGVLCGHYHVGSLSVEARNAAGVTLKALAHLAETAVFAYMGVDLFSLSGAGVTAFAGAHAGAPSELALNGSEHAANASAIASLHAPPLLAPPLASPLTDARRALAREGTVTGGEHANIAAFVFFCLVVVLLARIVVFYPLCLVANCFRGRRRQLSPRAIAMLTFAGLRGAIAFALAHNVHSEHRHSIAAATTTVVLATVFVLGGFTRTVIKLLGMEAAPASAAPTDLGDGHPLSPRRVVDSTVDSTEIAPIDANDSAVDGDGGGAGGSPAARARVAPDERLSTAAAKRAEQRAMNWEQRSPLTDADTSSSDAHPHGEGGAPRDAIERASDWFDRIDRVYLQPTFGNRRSRRRSTRSRTASADAADDGTVRRPHSLRSQLSEPALELSNVHVEHDSQQHAPSV